MQRLAGQSRWLLRLSLAVAIFGLAGALLVACSSATPGPAQGVPANAPAAAPDAVAPAASAPPSGAASASAPALKLLKASPEKGNVGTQFSLAGEGLPANKEVEFLWATWDGSYALETGKENVRFMERTFADKRVSLGRVATDSKGQVTATFKAPDDYGEVHDIFIVADGQDIGKGGFRILRTATMIPTQGPLGTPITITVKGIGWKPFESTMGLRYDNKYMGMLTAVTTKGTAVFQIRAAGPVGQHTVQLTGASPGAPYLNLQQSPVAHVPAEFRWTFAVTEDRGAPPDTLDWPDDRRTDTLNPAVSRTTAGGVATIAGLSATIEPASGLILSQASLKASGLPANSPVELVWATVDGNRLSPSGWSLRESSLLKATAGQDGSLRVPIQVPDGLGGWHVVKLVQGEKVAAELPYLVERSIGGVTPKRVKEGETFTVQVKGIGWTELDNGVAITYDNAYIGYACGFASNGDVTVTLVATSGPGTHLIDLYPMIYRAPTRGTTYPVEYWNFQLPFLTAHQDHPGLALGYQLPIYRLAIEVVE